MKEVFCAIVWKVNIKFMIIYLIMPINKNNTKWQAFKLDTFFKTNLGIAHCLCIKKM